MFIFTNVDRENADIMCDLFRLRYQVYCKEWEFEDPSDHPDQIETDDYDKHSLHFAAIRGKDQALIGTARLIMDSNAGYPLERHCTIYPKLVPDDRSMVGEVSRLSISKEFRKRENDKIIYDSAEDVQEDRESRHERRKNEFGIVLGLYKMVVQAGFDNGLTHFYAVMAKGLYVLLKRISINFHPIGPSLEYHGVRTPYILSLEDMMNDLYANNRILHDYFADRNNYGLMVVD